MEGLMDPRKRVAIEKLAAWCGPLFVLAFAVFWGIYGHNVPHPEAHAYFNSQEIHKYYTIYQSDLRFGYTMCAVFVVLYYVFACALAARSWRVEGTYPVWTIIEIVGGLMTAVFISGACMNWITATYRLDVVHVQVLNDLSYLSINMQWACTTIQMTAFAFIGWCDKRPEEEKWIPNWLSWFSVLSGLSFIADSYLVYTFDGPFCWSGWFSFNLTYADWLVWILLACWKMIKEVNKYDDNPERMFDPV